MADPLAAGDKLPLRVLTEGIAHAAVTARKPHARADRLAHIDDVIVTNLAHGPAGNNQIQLQKAVQIGEYVKSIADNAFVAVFFQKTGETL